MAIVDVSLPGGGYDVAAQIKAGGKTKVLLLVGRSQSFDIAKAQKAGIDAHIQKPFLTQQLVERVFTALGQPVPDKAVFRSTTMTIPLARKKGKDAANTSKAPKSSKPSLPPPTSQRAPAPPPPPSTPSLPPPVSKSAPPPTPKGRPSVPPVSAAKAPAPPSRAPQPPPMDVFAQSAVQKTVEKVANDPAIAAALNNASRDTVQQVAWEVVPRLAEAILKEEIAKLVRERLAAS
jgi:CheY-like chemotaxis protein